MTEKPASYDVSGSKQLPPSEEVNVAALARLFAATTNSYKYVFFISILDILKRRQFDVSEPIAFKELVVEILANAWYPHTYFKLSFGVQDKITQNLDALTLDIGEPILKFTDTDKTLLRATISAQQNLDRIVQQLSRYVPYRLIIPFVEGELSQVADRGKGNNADLAMPKVAETYFSERKPLYRFDSTAYPECQAIVFHPVWAAYLEKHYAIVRGWAARKWLEYMQKRNPNTPGLIYKVFAPTKRDSLAKQTAYWKIILENVDFYCIYSQEPLTLERLSLDHYLPWSFVAHDQLWNLIPTTPEVNSSKSNHFPPANYFERFVAAQHLGLTISREKMAAKSWNPIVEAYIEGLGIHTQNDLLDLDILRNAYSQVIQPLFSLAINQGFKLWQPPSIAQ